MLPQVNIYVMNKHFYLYVSHLSFEYNLELSYFAHTNIFLFVQQQLLIHVDKSTFYVCIISNNLFD
jgi:hypothetical protein